MADPRPDFFARLGLAPPITVDDVKQAYLALVKTAHPDHGGDKAEFLQIQEAYEQAMEYTAFRADRMKWLGVQAERYAAQEKVIQTIQALGGKVEVSSIDWMARSFGEDFAQLMDRVVGVELSGPAVNDETLESLVREKAVLQQLRRLDLHKSNITDLGVVVLRVFQELRHLDLSETAVTNECLLVVEWLPELESLAVSGTAISLLGKMKARFHHPRLRFS